MALSLSHKRQILAFDISDTTLEMMVLSHAQAPDIVSSLRVVIPDGVLEYGYIKDTSTLLSVLQKACAKIGISSLDRYHTIVSLPEDNFFLHVFDLPKHTTRERQNIITKKLARRIPLEENAMIVSYREIEKSDEVVRMITLTAESTLIHAWREVLEKMNATQIVFDMSTCASYRALFPTTAGEPILVIDIGSQVTSAGLFSASGHPYITFADMFGGETILQVLMSELHITREKAQEQTKKLKITNNRLKSTRIVQQHFTSLITDIKKMISFAQKEFSLTPARVVIIGGGTSIQGIDAFLSRALGLPVEQGKLSPVSESLDPALISVFGSALGAHDPRWHVLHPVIGDEMTFTSQKTVHVQSTESVSEALTSLNVTSSTRIRDPQKEMNATKTKGNLRTRIFIFLAIIVLGGIFLAGVARFQSINRKNRTENISEQLTHFETIQEVSYIIPVAVIPEEYTTDRVRGRVVTDTLETALSISEGVSIARRRIEKSLMENEELWPEPMNDISSDFPLETHWLVYERDDVKQQAVFIIDHQNTRHTPYAFNFIEVTGVQKTSHENIFLLDVRVNLSTPAIISEIQSTTDGQEQEKDSQEA